MEAVNIKVEYLNNPIGIDIEKPRFFWNCRGGKKQSAYQIICEEGQRVLWDSCKVISSEMTLISYEGEALASRMHVNVRIRLWDENDAPGGWTETAFEMGLLSPKDWHGKWITGDYRPVKNTRYPVDYFKKEFALKGKPVKARLYITACGLYEAKLNGNRVGRIRFAPGSTDYRKRIQYQVYDVKDLLREENRFTIALADGWYRGSVNAWGLTSVYGAETKLRCFIEIGYADGSAAIIESDDSFAWSNDGPLRFADLKDGEIYDAGMDPSYTGHARVTSLDQGVLLSASDNVAPKEHEIFKAKLLTTASGARILDFGQNIAGYIRFHIHGERGQKLHLRFGEMLDENGEFTQKNFQLKRAEGYLNLPKLLKTVVVGDKMKKDYILSPRQEITYICGGQDEVYKTEFAVFGFQYVLIDSDIPVGANDFEAIAVYSDMEQTGEFCCSEEKINQLFSNTLWSMKGNFLDLPTDCPTRERLGWTGDAQIFFESGTAFMDSAAFYRKYMRDLRDGQLKSGSISCVVPYSGNGLVYNVTGSSVGWSDAMVLLPYRFYKHYGDLQVLTENYDMMRRYAAFMIKNAGAKSKEFKQGNPYAGYIYEKGFHFGEWLEPEEYVDNSMKDSQAEVSTAYFAYIMRCMQETAAILRDDSGERLYAGFADGAKKAYQHCFLKEVPDTDRQAKLVRPLALGLAGDKTQAVAARLFAAVENRNYRVSTGFLSTPFILPLLSDLGRTDLAFRMIENEEKPGWLYEINKGATTVWESWEGTVSRNHYSPGSVCDWLYKYVLGIRVTGDRRFEIRPVAGGKMNAAKGSVKTIYGKVSVNWERKEDTFVCLIGIPANTEAEAFVGNKKFEMEAGNYRIEQQGEEISLHKIQ